MAKRHFEAKSCSWVRSVAAWAVVAVGFSIPGTGSGGAAHAQSDSLDSTVSANTGSVHYEVPFALPPGPGGLVPPLALTYSSLQGDGPLGVGWRIPFAEIRCAARFGIPDYASCPQYEYDGELLVGPDTNGYYHTFAESFSRIRRVLVSGWLGWEVTGADGTRLIFGTTPGSRIHPRPGAPVGVWKLAEVQDVFGNRIEIEYERSDPGAALPHRVRYGTREVRFYYEPRPDPVRDFAAGIERHATRRLREVEVISGGFVHQRVVLGYAAEGDYATHRTRLASVQRFGADCPLYPGLLAGCSSLPAHTFTYTDPSDPEFATPDGSQWLADPDFTTIGTTDLVDVNGDGLPDIIAAACRVPEHAWPCDDPDEGERLVFLGSATGIPPTPDPAWSAALAALTWEAPILRVVQWPGGGHLGSAFCKALPGTLTSGIAFDRRHPEEFALDLNALEVVPDVDSGFPLQTIAAEPHWRIVDLNGDGLADLVASTRVGGVWKKRSDDCGSDIPHTWVDAVGRAVFLNTGAGWERAPSLEAGLPVLAAMEISDHYGSSTGNDSVDPCAIYGWWGRDWQNSLPPTVCRQMMYYPANFVDLNGDGRLDLLAAVPTDARYLPAYETPNCAIYDRCILNPDRTLAFVQRRMATGKWEFVRDERFDLRDPVTDSPMHHVHQIQSGFDINGSHGEGFSTFFPMDEGFSFVDLNGDALVDVAWRDPFAASGHPHPMGPSLASGVLLNTGTGWCSSAPGSLCEDAARLLPDTPIGAEPVTYAADVYETGSLPLLIDVNGDRLPDFYRQLAPGDFRLELFEPARDPGDTAWRPDLSGRFDGAIGQRIDHDGDGAIDAFVGSELRLSQSRLPDLLRSIDNGRGGSVRFTYATDTAQRDPQLEVEADAAAAALHPDGAGSVRFRRHPAVASVRVEGPNRTSAVRHYAYARPAWCPEHRSGFGYGRVRITHPDGSSSDETYYQDHGRAGRLAERTVRDGDALLEHSVAIWETVDPATVPGAYPGEDVLAPSDREPSRVGRLVEIRSSYEYGAFPGDASGAVHRQRYVYDDVYGFNFVAEVESQRPTATTRTLRTPVPVDSARWITGLVASERSELPDRALVLSETTYAYTPEGLVTTRTRLDSRREAGALSNAPAVTHTHYDFQGNPSREVDAHGHAVEFCYDGNAAGHAWCDAPDGDGSLLVATRDPLGAVASFDVDPVFGAALDSASDYRDVPGTRVALDAFGRTIASWVRPEDGAEVLAAESIYDDHAMPPAVETRSYVDDGGADFVSTWRIGDGFGGTWREVERLPAGAGGAARFVGVVVWHDPAARTSRRSDRLPCPDAACSALVGDVEGPAVSTTTDAVGRVVTVATPEGIAVRRYGRTASDPVVVAPGWVETVSPPSLDVVLAKNPKGDLVRRTHDGDRVVAVDACANAVDPGQAGLETTVCFVAERTLSGHVDDSGPEVVYDTIAVAAADWHDPRHRRLAHVDTLGRLVELEDPDAGISQRVFDGAGQLISTTDARGLERVHAYDALHRVLSVDAPPGESDLARTYRSDELQLAFESIGNDARALTYDGFGRLRLEEVATGGVVLRAERHYDLLGRMTTLRYPDLGDPLRWEYDGAHLLRVCRGSSCDDPAATPYLQDARYDDFGRLVTMSMPVGMRWFGYEQSAHPSASTRRLVSDTFAGRGPSRDVLAQRWGDHDALGNPRTWSVQSPFTGVGARGAYTFDTRNRLASWTRVGVSEGFDYDALGNLVSHADAEQTFDHPAKPHALTARPDADVAYGHDAAGNVTSIVAPGEARHLAFDSAGRLVCAGSGPGICDQLRVFYDGDGRRIREEVPGVVTRRFLGDGLVATEPSGGDPFYRIEVFAFGERIATTTLASPEVALFGSVWIGGHEIGGVFIAALALGVFLVVIAWAVGGGLVAGVRRRPAHAGVAFALIAAMVVPAPALGTPATFPEVHHFVISDPLGSGIAIVDASGEVVRHSRYRPFGGIAAEGVAPGADPGRRIFAGHPEQAELALVHMQARWMDPASGTFLSVDPIVAGTADTEAFNAYSYARNNPVAFSDPSGACVVCPPPYPPFTFDAPPDFPRGGRARHRVDVSGRVFGGRWLFVARSQPGEGGDVGRPLAELLFDFDWRGRERSPMSPALNPSNGEGLLGFVEAVVRTAVEFVIGEDYGAAWWGFFGGWKKGPSGGHLPIALSRLLWQVRFAVPENFFLNGAHAWHSGSNAALTKALGLVGVPLILLGGVLHETPLDLGSFIAEHRAQGIVNHAIDSFTDVGVNLFGVGVGLFAPRSLAVDIAIEYGNRIPGPGDPDPIVGGGGGRYQGRPWDAWGQYPGGED